MSYAVQSAPDFEFLAENATDMLSRHAPDGTFIYVSGACRRIFGYEADELVGNNVYDYFHPEDVVANEAAHGHALNRTDTADTRYRFRCSDGSYRQVETTVRGVRDGAGELIEIHCMTRDISDRVESEELRRQWQACFTKTRRGITIADPTDSTMRSVNAALAAMHGGEAVDFVGLPLESLFAPGSAGELERRLLEAGPDDYIDYECEHVRLDGSVFPVRTEVMTVRDDAGEPLYRVGWFDDISEQQATEARQAAVQRDFESAFDEAPNGAAIVDLEGRFARVNPKLCELVGYSAEELGKLTFQQITHPDDLDADMSFVEQMLAGEIPGYEMEKRYFTKQGHQLWIHLSVSLVRDSGGRPAHFLSHIQDISARKRMDERLRELADKDSLTGLMNRRRFEEELGRQAARCARYGEHVALIVADLDGFKSVNDSQGHKAGDLVLRAVARGLVDRVRRSDTVARLGGDEFAILLLNVGLEEATDVAEEMRERIERDALVRGDGITGSFGLVHFEGGGVTADRMLVAGDMAMYQAKRSGRNQVVVPPPDYL